ncbi:MAG: hypothetical protein QNL62_08850 [Gammaproteobacteria bacterium]|nr:hypothetical protein [Gammaproteobacteria bacterium]
MNLEALTLEVRPRTPWESMDLAVRLAVSHWRLLFSSWMATIFPLFLIINIILLEDYPYWAFFLFWFLKPLYDRVPLFVLSRVIFSEQITWEEVVSAIPSLFKTGVLASLTLYRLDPGRAFALPVRQLEGLKGKPRRQRMNTLRRGTNNREVLFFILCFHLESLVFWGILGLLIMMLPTHMALQSAETLFLDLEPGFMTNALSMGLYFLVMMIVEILYVAGGFALYLNRRIILEGWDIELVFRKLSQRHNSTHSSTNSEKKQGAHIKQTQSLVTVFFASSLCLFFATFSPAIEAALQSPQAAYNDILPPVASLPLAPEASQETIQQVMADPVFKRFQRVETLEYTGKIDKDKDKKDLEKTQSWLTDTFEVIGRSIAFIFEIGLWLLLLLAIFMLVKYRDRLHLGFGETGKNSADEIPEILFGLDLREESLPEDVSAQALQLYRDSDYRAALALLYRATLAYLVRHYEFNLDKGATEGDCLELVVKKLQLESKDEVNYFVELTRAWQFTAYAHRIIPAGQMEQLCLNWSRFYSTKSYSTKSDTHVTNAASAAYLTKKDKQNDE